MIRQAPGQIYQTAVNTATPVVQTVASVPGRVRTSVVDTATSTVQSIRAAPTKVYQSAVSTGQSAATMAQPYVHRSIGIVTPYVESTLTNQRVQSLYQSRIVQGSIERATPYVTPVVTHPKVQEIATPVIEWARPRANTN